VKAGARRAVMPPAAPRRPRAARAAPGAANVPAAAAPHADVLAALAELLGVPAPSGAAPPAASSVPPSFVTELTRMHREARAPAAAGEEAFANVVKRIKAAPQSATLGTVDAMTIDIVAMLFDSIFEDRHLPDAAKALLARLQIPTLKVALLDRTFFSSRSHPARRLLDLVAEAAMGLPAAASGEEPALKLIAEVVERVVRDFETDLALFESLAARVAAFIEEQRRAETQIVERSARVVEEREREEMARLTAEGEVVRRLAAHAWVPTPVRGMLEDTWSRALASVHRVEGEGSPLWNALLWTMDELLWSVEPKVNPEDRKRLITMLPGMIRELHDGMDRGGEAAEKRDAFFGELVDCHAQAVKAGLRGLAALPESPPPVATSEAAIERAMIPAGDIRVEEIRLRAPRGPAAVRNVFTRTGIWTNLRRGTWVEFRNTEGAATRARLTWISPNKGVYLFTNPLAATAAVSISPDALAEQMRLGDAHILDDAPLVDRAVDSVLASLRRGEAPAQG